jgi:hypothetical protein
MSLSVLRKCLSLGCIAVALTFSACGGSTTPCSDSSFTATVKGADGVTLRTLAGKACWSLDGADWALGLYDGGGVNAIVIGRTAGGAPTRGRSYPLPPVVTPGSDDFGTRALLQAYNDVWVCSPGDTGSLSVTTAFADPAYGGFISLDLLCVQRLGDGTTVLGLEVTSFVATEGDVALIQ